MSRSKYRAGNGYGYAELVADVAHVLKCDDVLLGSHIDEMWGFCPYAWDKDGGDMHIMLVLDSGSDQFEVCVNEDGSGKYRFSASLPDGRKLWSNWIEVDA